MHVLTINSGSSSIKLAIYEASGSADEAPKRLLSAKIDRIGLPDPTFTINDPRAKATLPIDAPTHADGIDRSLAMLREREHLPEIAAAGHRIVHGGPRYSGPERVTPEVMAELRRVSPLAPRHNPSALSVLQYFLDRLGHVPQVVCFDTAFHRTMPPVARRLSVPRRYEAMGVQRYGFHGLSYTYLMEELERLAGPEAARGRVVLCHFGNGASLAAVRDGKCIDTSMSLTPAAGIPMGTRTGDIDPGLVGFLARTQGMTAEQFDEMASKESGLLGVSETSPDMRDLLDRRTTDPRAADAVEMFCYQSRKWIGAFAAALGGLDTLVFAGGIGENNPSIRGEICEKLAFLGITIDRARNSANAPVISHDGQSVSVRVIPTDEEIVIARAVLRLL